MTDPAALQAKLKLLSNAYAAQLPAKITQLQQAFDKVCKPVWDEEGFNTFYRMVHSMTGSGKTFSFATLSDAARKLEEYLKPLGVEKLPLTLAQCELVKGLLVDLNHSASQPDDAFKSELVAIAPRVERVPISRHVIVVEDDVELAEELKIKLSYFGFDVRVFHTTSDFKQYMKTEPSGIVLMDINFPGDNLGGINIVTELQQGRAVPLPVIFLSSLTDLGTRLKAARAGSVAYLDKPMNIGVLVDKLDELTSNQSEASYRVLIVDDTVSLSDYYAVTLEQAGMSVMVVNDPLQVMKPLLEFSPDLILIDMYMPGCNGMELAKIIRQIDAFISIPIVFLSAETNLDKQLVAIGLGGDDFLTKPIEPQHLVLAVQNRIKRSLVLRSFMVRDSLTGLLNHTAIKDQLAREIARAKRNDQSLAFAMVDIDNFKLVNDGYGHPAGDRVIKSLSRLLKQRLREHDLVGRYGGEEFAVILVDTDGSTAMKVLDTIRKDFSRLSHLSNKQEFTVTFSAGIADISQHSEASKLADAADKALYKAKHAGRNQIVVSDAPD